MQKKTIGILGCGWLGLSLAQTLVKKNYTVKGTTTSEDKINLLKSENITPYLVDLSGGKTENLDLFLKDLDILIVTIPPIRNEEIPSYAKNFELLNSFIKKPTPIIMMSSVSVYAPQKILITEENTNYSNEATAKQIRDGEDMLLQNHKEVRILRLGGLFGIDRSPVKYIVKQPYLVNPDLPINMIHLEDIIQFTIFLIEENSKDRIYNFVSPKYKNRREYYSQMAKDSELQLPSEGENDWTLEKKVDGTKIVKQSGLNYLF